VINLKLQEKYGGDYKVISTIYLKRSTEDLIRKEAEKIDRPKSWVIQTLLDEYFAMKKSKEIESGNGKDITNTA